MGACFCGKEGVGKGERGGEEVGEDDIEDKCCVVSGVAVSCKEEMMSLTSCCSGGERALLPVEKEEMGEEGKEEEGVSKSRSWSPVGLNSRKPRS